MICSNCGKECEKEYLNGWATPVSGCCNDAIHYDDLCPCPNESPDNCQSCRDKRTADNAKVGLYTKEDIMDALNHVGVVGYVRDLIMGRFE